MPEPSWFLACFPLSSLCTKTRKWDSKRERSIGNRDWGRNALQIRQAALCAPESIAGGRTVRRRKRRHLFLHCDVTVSLPRLVRALLRAADIFHFDLAQA